MKIVESTFNCCNNQLIEKKNIPTTISLRLPFHIGTYKHGTVPLNDVMNIKIKRAVALTRGMRENEMWHTICKTDTDRLCNAHVFCANQRYT